MNKKPIILTVDDDEDFNVLMKKCLSRLQVVVETTSNPETFLIRLKQLNPDLCIIDLNLDRNFGAGFQLIQAIRNKTSDSIPLIVMSRRSDGQDISTAFELGATDYIAKPLDDVLLLSKISQHLRMSNKISYNSRQEAPQLTYKKISPQQTACRINFPYRITEIAEFGITIEGDHFISRGALLKITHPVFMEMTGHTETVRLNVQQNWVNHEKGICGAYLEFDTTNEKLLNDVRSWLAKKATK
jgi:DNA-binding response OmpR family regulator